MSTWMSQIALRILRLGGSVGLTRPPIATEELVARRFQSDERATTDMRASHGRLVELVKTEYDQYFAGHRKEPPVIDILVISGGGDWGAFGAGFLKGWKSVLTHHPFAMPEFDAVTGVSTGTLIAPFAFLGDDTSINQLVSLYRNPQKDWVRHRGLLYFLPDNISFAEVPGLEREVRDNVTIDMLRRIAVAGANGRILAINTTNVDEGTSRVFNLVEEAKYAVDSGQVDRVHNIILASAGIPGAFPFRMIDGALYVDGGVTGNIVYGGRGSEEDTVPAIWQKAYPDLPIPKIRMWVLFNNQFYPMPEVTAPNWPAVIQRSLETATRSSTAIAIRHLHAMAEIARLKRKADVEVHVACIPEKWHPPVAGTFIKETMNHLADLGEQMGADSTSWMSCPPQ